ncbi:rhodanese-like domain-containing protein [bacterium]|nr:rhodanese-like domain-containing protein [bacterium]MBU1072309.1 rhodanese-like domain-containing protein [bacterium]MBU1677090.1 rhodanese-like domain-containing protein [bacterium]
MTSSRGKINLYHPRHVLREAAALLLATLVLAALNWALRPPRLPLRADLASYELDLGFPVTNAAAAVALYEDNSHIFIDTRPADPRASRIPGAFPISQARFEEDLREVYDFLPHEDPLLLFGDGNLLMISAVASRLQERGFGDITLMSGDLETWAGAGGAVTDPPAPGPETRHE